MTFSFLMIGNNKEIVTPHEFVNTIGYVNGSIRFIEIDDGVVVQVDKEMLSKLDNDFFTIIQQNPEALSCQLKQSLNRLKIK